MPGPIAIRRYLEIELTPERQQEIDGIFFASSNTRTFANDDVRAAFRERWLGRYLRHDADFAFLAQAPDGKVVGYLVGAIDDPAVATRFGDIGYFASLAAHTRRYPAHLHVNISPEFRNEGLGTRLIERFVAAARAVGAPGVHVVTSEGAANINFYNRNGFSEVARAGPGGSLVFLARAL